MILTSTSLFSQGLKPDEVILRGYIDCKFRTDWGNLYNVYQCFEEEAKKMCANIVYEFSLNPIQYAHNGENYDPTILGTGMAVCDPNLSHLDENCTCS